MKFKCLSIISIYYVQTKPVYVYSLYIVYFLWGYAISPPHLTLLSKETRHHFVFNSICF